MVEDLVSLFGDDIIFERTAKGRKALLGSAGNLSGPSESLLALVNGFTNLRSLVELMPDSRDIRPAVTSLYRAGLIRMVEMPRKRKGA